MSEYEQSVYEGLDADTKELIDLGIATIQDVIEELGLSEPEDKKEYREQEPHEESEEYIFLVRDLIDYYSDIDCRTLATKEEKLAYICIRKVMLMNDDITMTTPYFLLESVGLDGTDLAMQKKIKKGLEELNKRFAGLIVNAYKDNYKLATKQLHFSTDEENFIMFSVEDMKKISALKEDANTKVGIICFYATLLGSINKKRGDFQEDVGNMSIETLASWSRISKKSCMKYRDILAENKIIVVSKGVTYRNYFNECVRVSDCYARYRHMRKCNKYANNRNNAMIELNK